MDDDHLLWVSLLHDKTKVLLLAFDIKTQQQQQYKKEPASHMLKNTHRAPGVGARTVFVRVI